MTPDERNHFRQIIEASVNILKFAGQKPDSVTVGYGVVGKTLDLLNDADQLQSENARLRERLGFREAMFDEEQASHEATRERLAKIEKAARKWLSSFDTKIPENADSEYVDKLSAEYTDTANALRAALDGGK